MASLSKSARKNGAGSYENHTAIDAQEREGERGSNVNGLDRKLTQYARPPRRVQAWDTTLYNTNESSTEEKPPAYDEVNDDADAEGVYTEMDYEEPVPIIVKTSWWSKKRIYIFVALLLVLFGSITCAVVFPMGLVLKSGDSNPLADLAVTSTFTTMTTTSSSIGTILSATGTTSSFSTTSTSASTATSTTTSTSTTTMTSITTSSSMSTMTAMSCINRTASFFVSSGVSAINGYYVSNGILRGKNSYIKYNVNGTVFVWNRTWDGINYESSSVLFGYGSSKNGAGIPNCPNGQWWCWTEFDCMFVACNQGPDSDVDFLANSFISWSTYSTWWRKFGGYPLPTISFSPINISVCHY